MESRGKSKNRNDVRSHPVILQDTDTGALNKEASPKLHGNLERPKAAHTAPLKKVHLPHNHRETMTIDAHNTTLAKTSCASLPSNLE